MDWTDEGIVLAARKHGESAAIVNLMTRAHGRHAGLVRGGAGRRARGVLQPGNEVAASWRARLAEHLGTYTCELARARAAGVLHDPLCLAGLTAACALTDATLPEREPHAAVFAGLGHLLQQIEGSDQWPADYVRWEIALLRELGFGLDLSSCAVSGAREGLAYVSPNSGRAVTATVAEPYRDRLLRLPAFVLAHDDEGAWDGSAPDIVAGLALAGYFLENHVLGPQNAPLPAARLRLVDRFSRGATISGGIVPS